MFSTKNRMYAQATPKEVFVLFLLFYEIKQYPLFLRYKTQAWFNIGPPELTIYFFLKQGDKKEEVEIFFTGYNMNARGPRETYLFFQFFS